MCAVRRGQFSRVEEHLFFVLFGVARVRPWIDNMLPGADDAGADDEADPLDEAAPDDDDLAEGAVEPIEWLGLRRREPSSVRGSRPGPRSSRSQWLELELAPPFAWKQQPATSLASPRR
jgi:adenine-specific DNA-methyltransferase